ncbi:MAG: hypothetical protein FIA97_15475 [Methylococcaceae bacterium]|nr:hypothetical protein [Methylococcaceae bacterium]
MNKSQNIPPKTGTANAIRTDPMTYGRISTRPAVFGFTTEKCWTPKAVAIPRGIPKNLDCSEGTYEESNCHNPHQNPGAY